MESSAKRSAVQQNVELEALRYFDRLELVGLQIHSSYLRDLVNRHACIFPLRSIRDVCILSCRVDFRLKEEGDDDWITVEVAEEQNLEGLFHRTNNAFIHRLQLSFRPEALPFLHYVQANAIDLQCQVAILEIEATDEEIDYALVGFVGAQLQPQIYKMSTSSLDGDFILVDDYAELFAHDALRGNIAHLEYDLNKFRAPDCIISELLAAKAVETCEMTTRRDPRPWIREFMAMFIVVDRGADIVGSVTVLQTCDAEALRVPHDASPLYWPRHTDVPTPHSGFVKKWVQNAPAFYGSGTFTESAAGDLYVVENPHAGKKLEVFAWTIEHARALSADPDDSTLLHYAFLLQVADM